MLEKGKYPNFFDRIALAIIAISISMASVFQILNIQQKTRTSSPIPNATMDSDGVIRLNPQNGCGPFAHVESHPVYGQLCVQDQGSWKAGTDGPIAEKSPPCAHGSVGGSSLSCQPTTTWSSHQ